MFLNGMTLIRVNVFFPYTDQIWNCEKGRRRVWIHFLEVWSWVVQTPPRVKTGPWEGETAAKARAQNAIWKSYLLSPRTYLRKSAFTWLEILISNTLVLITVRRHNLMACRLCWYCHELKFMSFESNLSARDSWHLYQNWLLFIANNNVFSKWMFDAQLLP